MGCDIEQFHPGKNAPFMNVLMQQEMERFTGADHQLIARAPAMGMEFRIY